MPLKYLEAPPTAARNTKHGPEVTPVDSLSEHPPTDKHFCHSSKSTTSPHPIPATHSHRVRHISHSIRDPHPKIMAQIRRNSTRTRSPGTSPGKHYYVLYVQSTCPNLAPLHSTQGIRVVIPPLCSVLLLLGSCVSSCVSSRWWPAGPYLAIRPPSHKATRNFDMRDSLI